MFTGRGSEGVNPAVYICIESSIADGYYDEIVNYVKITIQIAILSNNNHTNND